MARLFLRGGDADHIPNPPRLLGMRTVIEKLLERLQGAVTANKSMGQTVLHVLHVNSEVLRVTRHTLTDDAWSLVRDRSRVVIP